MLDAIIVIAQYARDQAMGSARDQGAKVSLRRVDLSRKFWSAEISVRRTKITGKIGPPGPNFPGKIGPTLEIMVRV